MSPTRTLKFNVGDQVGDFSIIEDLGLQFYFKKKTNELSSYKTRYLKCKCVCGKIVNVPAHSLGKSIISCGCNKSQRLKKRKQTIIIGQQIGRLTVIKDAGICIVNYTNRKTGKQSTCTRNYWICHCECGNVVTTYISNLKIRENTRSCGCLRDEQTAIRSWRGVGEIPAMYFSQLRRGATSKGRNFEFTITMEYVWELFIKQNRKCALSGLDIEFAKRQSHTEFGTASLDRIDNSKGYVDDNVQWLHKDVNRMKMDHTSEDFLNLCKKIVNTNKQKENQKDDNNN